MGNTVVRVVGAVVERNGSVFAARRNPDRSAGGLWEFPGGKIEDDEEPDTALQRELREELNVDISVGPLIDQSISTVGSSQIELSCYLASFGVDDPVESTDHDAFQWVPLSQVTLLDWAPGDIPIVGRLELRLSELGGLTRESG